MVSRQLLEELKTIIKDEYGKDLEMKEVTSIAENLVGYFDLLAKINYRQSQSCPEINAEENSKNRKNRQSKGPFLKKENKLS